jgi:hypothetical protein
MILSIDPKARAQLNTTTPDAWGGHPTWRPLDGDKRLKRTSEIGYRFSRLDAVLKQLSRDVRANTNKLHPIVNRNHIPFFPCASRQT